MPNRIRKLLYNWNFRVIESLLVVKLLFNTGNKNSYSILVVKADCSGNSLLNLAMKLLRANYAFLLLHFLTSKLLLHAFPESPTSPVELQQNTLKPGKNL